MKENVIQQKSYMFAIEIVETFRLIGKKEPVLAKQLLRSGTSIGANVEEAIGAQSKKDFYSKMSIGYREARETLYWLRILIDTRYLDSIQGQRLKASCEELIRILGSIQKSLKNQLEIE
jgi:four helix bundle protein